MAVNIGPRIGIDGEAEYRKQIQAIIQETKTLKSEYDKVSSAVDKDTLSIKKNAEQKKVLNQQIEAQQKRIQELSRMMEESSKKFGENDQRTLKWKQAVNEATTELNELENKLKSLPSSLEIVGKKMQAVGEHIQNAGHKMESFGRTIAPVSAAAAAGIAASAKSFMDFEEGMSKVAAISGATGDDLDALTEKAKEMGAQTKFSASESADAFSYMAMAGWKTEQMLAGIAPIMNLAAASGEDLANTSDIVTDALTAFGLKAEDAGQFADVLAAASSNANTNVAMMGESFKYAAPVAGSLGYSIEDVALALGLMANSGIKADMAGTSLRNMLNRMAKPTKESAMAMDRLGLSLADEEGKMYSLRQIMDQMRDSFSHINMPVEEFEQRLETLGLMMDDGILSEKQYAKEVEELSKQAYGAEGAEKARAAAMLGGTRAMSAMLAIANASEEDYNKLADAVDNSGQSFAKLKDGSIVPMTEAMASGQEVMETLDGTAAAMAATMQENVAGAWTQAKSAMEGAAIEAGEVLAPYLEKAANEVKNLAQWFTSLDQETQDTIVATTAAVAAASPVLITLGKITTSVGSVVSTGGKLISFLGGLTPAAEATARAMSGVGAAGSSVAAGLATIAAPAAIVIAALVAVGAAFATMYHNSEEFRDHVASTMESVKATFSDFASHVSGRFEYISQRMEGIVAIIKPIWEGLCEFLQPAFEAALDQVTRIFDNWSTMFKGVFDIFAGIFTADWNLMFLGIEELITGFINNLIDAFRYGLDIVENMLKNAKLELPHIPLPHFKISGKLSLDPPEVPHIDVDWYQKAMTNGMILNKATIFGAAGGKLLGAGEAGAEAVVGVNSLRGMITSAVQSALMPGGNSTSVTYGDTIINVYGAPGQDIEELADIIEDRINYKIQAENAVMA